MIWLLPARSVRWSARSTQVERALCARFRLWIQNRDGSGLSRFNFFTAPGDSGFADTARGLSCLRPTNLAKTTQRPAAFAPEAVKKSPS